MLARIVTTLLLIATLPSWVEAAPPWASLVPFRRIEADPSKTYWLTEQEGPWMILCASFAGADGKRQADDLVYELRKEHKLNAYVHRQHYDYTKAERGIGLRPDGSPKMMRPQYASEFDAYAVLVGDYPDIEDSRLQSTLEKLKNLRPECLEVGPNRRTHQNMAVLREIQRRLSADPERQRRGPMSKAFATLNPLLPEELIHPKQGPDPLVEEMNSGVEHSLLACPGKYSVRVATFRGADTFNLREMERADRMKSKLAEAAEKAHLVVESLRQRGVEAYEFHDRHESIVTVGSFEEIGTPRPDGKIEIDPAVKGVIDAYQAQQLPGLGQAALVPRREAGIALDVQPMPVEVPQGYSLRTALFGRR